VINSDKLISSPNHIYANLDFSDIYNSTLGIKLGNLPGENPGSVNNVIFWVNYKIFPNACDRFGETRTRSSTVQSTIKHGNMDLGPLSQFTKATNVFLHLQQLCQSWPPPSDDGAVCQQFFNFSSGKINLTVNIYFGERVIPSRSSSSMPRRRRLVSKKRRTGRGWAQRRLVYNCYQYLSAGVLNSCMAEELHAAGCS